MYFTLKKKKIFFLSGNKWFMCKYSPKSKQNQQSSPKLSEKLPFDFRQIYTILSQVGYFRSSALITFSSLNCLQRPPALVHNFNMLQMCFIIKYNSEDVE